MFRGLPRRDALTAARRAFYNAGGPWLRRGLFEALGSQRYSRPALHGMERRLEELLPKRGGTFVEAGAHDGYTDSNTYYLERFKGWRGLLVEAIPELHRKAARRRQASVVVNAALVGPEREGEEVVMRFGDLTSTLGDSLDDLEHTRRGLRNAGLDGYDVRVTGRTLSSLLDTSGIARPDLVVLDIEGHELEALSGLDLDRHGPELLVIEMLNMPAQRRQFDVLLAGRYEFVEPLSRDDALYRRTA